MSIAQQIFDNAGGFDLKAATIEAHKFAKDIDSNWGKLETVFYFEDDSFLSISEIDKTMRVDARRAVDIMNYQNRGKLTPGEPPPAGVPNLDDCDDEYRRAAAMVFDNLRLYCQAKNRASYLRRAGYLTKAQVEERVCGLIYEKLPSWAKW